jgi:hypothetical protein
MAKPPPTHPPATPDEAVPLATPVAKVAPPMKAKAAPAVPPYRPTVRPSICMLTVFDDGKTEGEVIRIRTNRFVIGRSEGDFLIPHDEQISSKHIEIGRQLIAGQHRWVISDLQSTNGLFLRVSRTALNDRTEFLVGKGRYRFEHAIASSSDTIDHVDWTPPSTGTQAFGELATTGVNPALVELVAGGIVSRVQLTKLEYWIGSAADCAVGRTDDPFIEAKHVRVFRDARGVWNAQNNRTLNGLWLKVPQVIVEESCLCQIGEQRFRLKVGG